MSAFAEDQERRLIPRWRFADQFPASAEFAGDPRGKKRSSLDRSYLEEKLADWDNTRALGTAIDLVSCGIGGGWLTDVRAAAEYLAKYEQKLSPQVNSLVRHALRRPVPFDSGRSLANISSESSTVTFDEAREKVAASRLRLQRDPRNMLAWLDLSRGWAILGEAEKAIWAIERALYLAPHHRHALRAASRLFVHTGHFGRAHRLLYENPRTATDPWLMAAEISVAKIAGKKPRFAGRGRRLLDSGQLAPEHLTELQSAIGTLEYYNGANRRARKDLRASLVAPTDNSVAQARWMRKQLPGLSIADSAFELPQSFEARCWRALEEAKWDEARRQCIEWLYDEPFSSRPAQVGSYIGVSLTADPAFAEACARAGLQSDPEDSTLRNNLAVALAYQGEVEEAIEHYRRIKLPLEAHFPSYVYWATTGLLYFRSGDIDAGRQFYERAEVAAPGDRKVRVAVFRAREEVCAGTDEAGEHVTRACRMGRDDEDERTQRMLTLLRAQLNGKSKSSGQLRSNDELVIAHPRLAPMLQSVASNAIDDNLIISSSGSNSTRRVNTMASQKNSHTDHRSSVTGRFLKEGYAKRYPHRSQKESIPDPGRGDTGRSKKGK